MYAETKVSGALHIAKYAFDELKMGCVGGMHEKAYLLNRIGKVGVIRPFCITILYHNLLLFIDIFHIRDDTYVVSSIFTCLMIIGELTAEVRILLEKGPSRHYISKDHQFQENTQKFIFLRKMEVARRKGRGEPPGAHTTWWPGLALGRATWWCGRPGPPLPAPPHVYRLPKNLRPRGDQR
jgi:hypothetical protein